MTKPAGEHVYVLGTSDARTVKIGRTANVPKRVGEIQRMSAVPVHLLWSHPGGHELEAHLHRQFSALRTHGEWFTFTHDALPLIKWAVTHEPWRQPKVSLKKPRPRAIRPCGEQRKADRVAAAERGRELDPQLAAALADVVAAVRAIEDPLERYEAIGSTEELITAALKERLRSIANGLRNEDRSWREVGELLNVSGQRAFQIASGTR